MNQERVDMVASAIFGQRGRKWSVMESLMCNSQANRALAAADALMLSDKTVTRVARMLQSASQPKRAWEDCGPQARAVFRSQAHALLTAAVRGDDESTGTASTQ